MFFEATYVPSPPLSATSIDDNIDLNDKVDIEPDLNKPVDHVIFVIHGIGQQTEKYGHFYEHIENLQETTRQILQSKIPDHNVRIELIPIEWHRHIHEQVDPILNKITLKSIPTIRLIENDYLADVLYYFSKDRGQKIIDNVTFLFNTSYQSFMEKHPNFDGKIIIMGYSLGGIITWDILSHQRDISNNEAEQNMYTKLDINFSKLDFKPNYFFGLGSPIGAVLTFRGQDPNLYHPDFDIQFENVFHPFDPLGYRFEPLFNDYFTDKPAVLVERSMPIGPSFSFPSMPSFPLSAGFFSLFSWKQEDKAAKTIYDATTDAIQASELKDTPKPVPKDEEASEIKDTSKPAPKGEAASKLKDTPKPVPKDEAASKLKDTPKPVPKDEASSKLKDTPKPVPKDEAASELKDTPKPVPEVAKDEAASEIKDTPKPVPKDEASSEIKDTSKPVPKDEAASELKDTPKPVPKDEAASTGFIASFLQYFSRGGGTEKSKDDGILTWDPLREQTREQLLALRDDLDRTLSEFPNHKIQKRPSMTIRSKTCGASTPDDAIYSSSFEHNSDGSVVSSSRVHDTREQGRQHLVEVLGIDGVTFNEDSKHFNKDDSERHDIWMDLNKELHKPGPAITTPLESKADVAQEATAESPNKQDKQTDGQEQEQVNKLPGRHRMDYVLQPDSFMSMIANEYLVGLRAHFSYWTNKDFIWHMLRRIENLDTDETTMATSLKQNNGSTTSIINIDDRNIQKKKK